MWTVERRGGVWVVETEDGEIVRKFDSRENAEEWLDFQQAAAEAMAE